MDKWIEQIVLKKSTNDKQILEEMLNILRHNENENQNNTDSPSHRSQNGNHKKQTNKKPKVQGKMSPYP
jgi:hypothetical protein